jgi:hypothetical protein
MGGDYVPSLTVLYECIKKIQLFLNMLLNILKTPKDLQLFK